MYTQEYRQRVNEAESEIDHQEATFSNERLSLVEKRLKFANRRKTWNRKEKNSLPLTGTDGATLIATLR